MSPIRPPVLTSRGEAHNSAPACSSPRLLSRLREEAARTRPTTPRMRLSKGVVSFDVPRSVRHCNVGHPLVAIVLPEDCATWSVCSTVRCSASDDTATRLRIATAAEATIMARRGIDGVSNRIHCFYYDSWRRHVGFLACVGGDHGGGVCLRPCGDCRHPVAFSPWMGWRNLSWPHASFHRDRLLSCHPIGLEIR
jgi:hypothetical protein